MNQLALPQVEGKRAGAALAALYAGVAITVAAAYVAPLLPVVVVLAALGVGITVGSPRHGVVVVVLATVLLPQPFSVSAGPITVSVGRLMLAALALGWLLHLGRSEPVLHNRRSPMDGAMLALLGTMLLSLIVNLPSLSDYEIAGALRKLLVFGFDYFLLFWIAMSTLRDRAQCLRLLRVIAALVSITALLGLVEYLTKRNVFEFLAPALPRSISQLLQAVVEDSSPALGRGLINRVRSTFEGPLAFGIVLVLTLPVVVSFTLSAGRHRTRLIWGAASAIIASAVLLTAARSVYLLMAATFLTFVLMVPDRRSRLRIVLASLAIVGLFLLQPDVRRTMVAFFQPQRGVVLEGSLQARVDDFTPVFALVDERPFFGYGPRTFARDELLRNQLLVEQENLVLDNAYLGHLAEVGAIGILGLGALLAMAYVMAYRVVRLAPTREDHLIAIGLFAMVQSWILMGFAADVYVFNAPPKVFFVMLAVVASLRCQSGWQPRPRSVSWVSASGAAAPRPAIAGAGGRPD